MRANSSIFRTVLALFGLLAISIGAAAVSPPAAGHDVDLNLVGNDLKLEAKFPNSQTAQPASAAGPIVPTVAGSIDDPLVSRLSPGAAADSNADSTGESSVDSAVDSTADSTAEPGADSAADLAIDSGAAESEEAPAGTVDLAPKTDGAGPDNGSDPDAIPVPQEPTTDPQSKNATAETTAYSPPTTDENSPDDDVDDGAGEGVANIRSTNTSVSCSSNSCPSGIGLEPIEISGNKATFGFFPIAGADPTFSLQRAFPTKDGSDPLPAVLVDESTVTIDDITPGTEYILTADRFFGIDAGSTMETIYFQTISPLVDRFCQQVEADFERDLIMQRDGDRRSSLAPVIFDPACRSYDVWLHASDLNHRAGFQSTQLGEQWQLEGLNQAGEVLYRSPSTPDLEETETIAFHHVGELDQLTTTQVIASHTGEGNINSVRAGATFIPVNPNPRTPSLCGTLDVLFINPTLANGIETAARSTVAMPSPALARQYRIWLYSRDEGHATGQSGGGAEQWFVEGLDADGNVVYTSPVTPDLPDDQVLSQFMAGTVSLNGISSFRGRHLGRLGTNTVEASMMLVPVDVLLPDEPYPLWCKHLNLQRP